MEKSLLKNVVDSNPEMTSDYEIKTCASCKSKIKCYRTECFTGHRVRSRILLSHQGTYIDYHGWFCSDCRNEIWKNVKWKRIITDMLSIGD